MTTERSSTLKSSPDRRSTVRSPWITVGVILIGSYASVLNGQITGVALPTIAADIGTTGGFDVDWVVTSYLIGVVMAQPVTGWLADRLGRRAVFVASLVVFAVGALLCLGAPNVVALVVGRFVQGLGGGAIIPIGMATVFDLFPVERRGRAMSVWGLAVMAGPAAGPPLGGWIVSQAHWRWIFALFAIVGVLAASMSAWLMRDVGHREARKLDLIGWALASAAVVAIVVGAREVALWGLTSPRTIGVAVVSVVLVTHLVRRSLRHPSPVIEFRMFASSGVAIGMAVVAATSVAQFARLNFIPIELQVVRGLDAQSVGLLIAPAAIGSALSMPIGGWLVDRFGSRLPAVGGLLIVATGLWQLAHLGPDGSRLGVISALLTQGFGTGLVTIPATVTMMNSLPARYVTQSSALSALNRQLSGAIGVALLGATVVAQLGAVAPSDPDIAEAQAAYNGIFVIGFWLIVVAALAAVFLPGRREAGRYHRDRIAETAAAPADA